MQRESARGHPISDPYFSLDDLSSWFGDRNHFYEGSKDFSDFVNDFGVDLVEYLEDKEYFIEYSEFDENVDLSDLESLADMLFSSIPPMFKIQVVSATEIEQDSKLPGLNGNTTLAVLVNSGKAHNLIKKTF